MPNNVKTMSSSLNAKKELHHLLFLSPLDKEAQSCPYERTIIVPSPKFCAVALHSTQCGCSQETV